MSRAERPRRNLRRLAASALMLVAALVAGHVVNSRLATDTGGSASFVRSAEIGETAGLEYADVRLTDVRPAKRLLGPGSGAQAVEASGVFVVAVLELTPTRAPVQFLGMFLVDDQDRRYRASFKSGCPPYPDAPTAVTVHSMACFDVPPDRLEGLRLRVARGSPDFDELRRDDLAEFDLEVSASDEDEWAATTAAYDVVEAGVDAFELQPAEIIEDPEAS